MGVTPKARRLNRRFREFLAKGLQWAVAAKKAGYRAPIAAGEQTYAVLANFLVDLFGVDFLRGGRLEAAFTKPVFYGDRLTSHARVTTASGSAIEVEVWVDNDRGERVAIGTAGFNARPA